MEFESALRESLGTSDDLSLTAVEPGHISPKDTDPTHPEVYEVDSGMRTLDGNTVNRAKEMANMAENQILYDASVEMLKKKLGMIRYAVSEGGGGSGDR